MKKLLAAAFVFATCCSAFAQGEQQTKYETFPANVSVVVNADKTCIIRVASSVGFNSALGGFGLLGALAQAASQLGPISDKTLESFEKAEAFAKQSECTNVQVAVASALDEAINESLAMQIGERIRQGKYETSMAMTQWGIACGNTCAYMYMGGIQRHERFKATMFDSRKDSGISLSKCLNGEYVEKMIGAVAKEKLASVCSGKITTDLAKELKIVSLSN